MTPTPRDDEPSRPPTDRREFVVPDSTDLAWREIALGRGRSAFVPDRLPDRPAYEATSELVLPIHLDWSTPARSVDLADPGQRARVYEVVLREGRPTDIEFIVDSALLVEIWDELVLPRRLRAAWQPLVDEARGAQGVERGRP